jgi:hypothetical protein
MAVTGYNMTTVSMCDAVGDWSAVGGTNSLVDNTVYGPIEGATCMQNYSASGAARGADWTWTSNQDLTNKMVIFWFSTSKMAGIPAKGANGMRIRITDVSGNWAEWDIFGGDTMPHGGWIPWAILAAESTSSRNGGTFPTLTQIRKVGWRCGGTVSAKTYIYWDAVRYGQGLLVTGGTSSSPVSFADIATAEATYAYGVFVPYSGVYYAQGKIVIGDTGSGDTYFEDTGGSVIVFKSAMVGDSFLELLLVGGSGNTEIYLGEKVGSSGISGVTIISESGSTRFAITASDTDIDKYGFYGCTLTKAKSITLQAYNADKEFLGCNVVESGEMIPGTGIVNTCNFISSPGRAIRISSASHHVADCNFINCETAIHHDVGGPSGTPLEYDYDELMFFGGTYHIENSASTPNYYIDIDRINGSNPDDDYFNNSNGGTTVLLEIGVQLTLTGLVDGSDISILDAGTTDERENVQENSGTTYIYSYSYAASDYIDIGVFKAGYLPYYIRNYLLPATNGNLPIAQRIDRDYLE